MIFFSICAVSQISETHARDCVRAQWVRHDVVPRPRPHLRYLRKLVMAMAFRSLPLRSRNEEIQPPTGRWHRATVDRHLHPSEYLPSSNHILLAKALYFARQCSNSHTCALACHKYIVLDGVATRIENQQGLRPRSLIVTTSKMTMMQRPRSLIRPYLEQQCPHRP